MRARLPRPAACLCALVLVMAGIAGCTGSTRTQAEGAGHDGGLGGGTAPPQPGEISLTTDNARPGGPVIAQGGPGAPYNYGPTVMLDGGPARMWWCSQYPTALPPGDDILYGEAQSLDGPFTGPGGSAPAAVLSGSPGHFDGSHTCDPSVIRVDGTYYLYYTGAAGDHALGNAIGLATSTDGVTWARANEGNPIVSPSDEVRRDNLYGAGQPAVVYLDGWFYLMFTDTTGRTAGPNGAGQFVLRAHDPVFSKGVEALGDNGFSSVGGTSVRRARSVVDAFSADLMWVDALDAFAVAHETGDGTLLTFFTRDFAAAPYRPVLVPGDWREGPGLVRGPAGHAPVSRTDPCGRVPVDVVRATVTGEANAPTGLRRFGTDITGVSGCAGRAQALAVLDGFAMPSPERTMDLVVAGQVVRIDRRSVAEKLAARVLDQRIDVLDQVPVAAHVPSGARAVQATGYGTGLILDDGKLWPIPSPDVAALNGSVVTAITPAQWLNYPMGPTLAVPARGLEG